MFRSIDGKSVLIGGLLVLVAVCGMGAVPLISGEFSGRFSLVAHNVDHGGVYVIDTVTGQVWEQQNNIFPNPFYAPKLGGGYAPEEEPMEPNWTEP